MSRRSAVRALLLEALEELDRAADDGDALDGCAVVWTARTSAGDQVVRWVNTPGPRDSYARIFGLASRALTGTG